MLEIIPLKKENIEDIKTNTLLETENCYITSLTLISKLLSMDKFPIKNKQLSIISILEFMRHIDIINYEKKNIIQISGKELTKRFTSKTYKKFLDMLSDLEIMTKVPHLNGEWYNIENKITCQYRLHNNYINDDLCLVISKSKKLEVNIETKVNFKFENTILNIEVDFNNAIIEEFNAYNNELITLNSLRIRINRLLSLNVKRSIKKGYKSNRIYHSLSSISRISRKHLSIKGQKFNDIDVKNCQPLLLCYLLKKENMKMDDSYQYHCESGLLYENFITEEMDREEVKKQLYRCIFFDFKPNEIIAIRFNELYPNTYTSLKELDGLEQTLASKLQNIEADIFNNLIPKNSKYYYTLFDAIYFIDITDCIDLLDSIKLKFADYNIKPILTLNGGTDFDIIE